jgi:AraC-like DNA-binding protein
MPADSIRYFRLPFAGVEAMRAQTARAFPRHTHDHYGIGCVDAGGHASWSGRGPVEAGPGSFISVNPGEVHDGHAVGGAARAWRILYLERGPLTELLADVNDGANPEFTFDAPVFDDGAMRSAFERAFACTTMPDDADGRRICETALLTLAAALRGHGTAALPHERGLAPPVRRARAWIDADPSAPHALSTLSKSCGLSRYQLIRGFKSEIGLAPHAYIVQRRLALARRLIRAGRELAEVAIEAGFCDQSHLARCFSRQFGVPPGRYALLS